MAGAAHAAERLVRRAFLKPFSVTWRKARRSRRQERAGRWLTGSRRRCGMLRALDVAYKSRAISRCRRYVFEISLP
jgi:hypothetical protein